MDRFTPEWTRAWLRDLAACRPTCGSCETLPFSAFSSRPDPSTWDVDWFRDTYTRRCADCRQRFSYPWAASLDPERVADWLDRNAEQNVKIDLELLRRECADRGGLRFL